MFRKFVAACCCVLLFSSPVAAGIPEIIIDGTVVSERSIIDDACSFAANICNDDSHGYNIDDGWGPGEFHCIGLVMRAYKAAGYDMGACWVGKMPERLMAYGFADVTDSVDLNTGVGLRKGDIMWMMHKNSKHGHTELYIGDGLLAGARGLGINNDIAGDQDGSEVAVIPYTNLDWERVFRPVFDEPFTSSPQMDSSEPEIVIETIYEPEIVIETVEDKSCGKEPVSILMQHPYSMSEFARHSFPSLDYLTEYNG